MEQKRLLHDMEERVKELTCLHDTADSIRKRTNLEDIFQDVVAFLPRSWRYPEITRGRIHFDGKDVVSEPFERTEWFQTADIIVGGERRGFVEVCYLEQRPDLDEGPFLKDECNLIDSIARALSEAADRKQAEDSLRNEKHFVDVALDSLPGVFYVFTEEGKFLRWNSNFQALSGYSREEFSLKHPVDLFPAEEQPLVKERIGEGILERKILCRGRSSSERWNKDSPLPHRSTGEYW